MKINSKIRKKYKEYKKNWIKNNTTPEERGIVEANYEDTINEMCVESGFDFDIQSRIYPLEEYLREHGGYNNKMYLSLKEFYNEYIIYNSVV